jgi:hypothetical protein
VLFRSRLGRQRLELASVVLAAICFLVLGLGTWRQASLYSRKDALLKKVQAAQEAVQANEALTEELITEYEGFRPLFAAQQNTVDTLKTLALLQQSRSNRSFWYVVLADQQSYFSQPPALSVTNKLAGTNPVVTATSLPAANVTNLSRAKPGFIAELCIPEDAEAARRILSELVKNELNDPRLFAKVDSLSDDLRRDLADPKVMVTNRHMVLALDFAQTEFQLTSLPKKSPAAGLLRGTSRRVARPAAWAPPESGENNTPIAP